ncbi:glycerol-3-phosphate acyltransferase [Olsenella sp. Marseille-P4559]|uniref:glycerol-3-phosphate acyltransferase n=1 Tax=Olsenella sp. Marseille-P4559 TaxID=2364795 RepID=UPI00103271CC|nr:glycerol-3-phosphate acyltransferase [Olsenella sp. Marseille-P4559]
MSGMGIVVACSLAVGYACGSFLTAELTSRHASGKSAFDVGEGNPGMANMGATYGTTWAAVTLAGDIAKTILAFVVAGALFPADAQVASATAMVGTTLGHVFPAWHHFHGGKGVATTCTGIILMTPAAGGAAAVIGLLVVLFGGYLCLGALAIPAAWLVIELALGDTLHAIAGAALMMVAVFCHGGPVAGIRAGKTPRAAISEKFLSALFKNHR